MSDQRVYLSIQTIDETVTVGPFRSKTRAAEWVGKYIKYIIEWEFTSVISPEEFM